MGGVGSVGPPTSGAGRIGRAIALVVVALMAAFIVGIGPVMTWSDAVTLPKIHERVTNDTSAAITWKCWGGDVTMKHGETASLSFATQPEDIGGCDYAGDVEMCVNEFFPASGQHVTASYAIREWACK
ncbi:hypothetical protein ABCS02_32845 [Microbacterium sp. X-17]|uniref:hypothetical protein n=1 Tax=Microbacterium sp. X-17 TaxID=3144404 RepID=UPI0031F4B33E